MKMSKVEHTHQKAFTYSLEFAEQIEQNMDNMEAAEAEYSEFGFDEFNDTEMNNEDLPAGVNAKNKRSDAAKVEGT